VLKDRKIRRMFYQKRERHPEAKAVGVFVMKLLFRLIKPSIFASLYLLARPTTAPSQVANGKGQSESDAAPSTVSAASLQKKADEAQARIRENQSDSDELKRAIKINEVGVAKQVLLRNGFTAKDLENAKISLRTGGVVGGEDGIRILTTCCDPKEIVIQRTLENFTK